MFRLIYCILLALILGCAARGGGIGDLGDSQTIILSDGTVIERDFIKYNPYDGPPAERQIYKPDYPVDARNAGIEGRVVARVYIDETGKVVRVEIVQSPAKVFDQSVREALMKSSFYPAMKEGAPVKSKITMRFDFRGP